MTLGQRIKETRLEKQMTQQEVVGDFITRNMLSKIENDSATPSVKTLEYLSSVLQLPAGYFLSNYDMLSREKSSDDSLFAELDIKDENFAALFGEKKLLWEQQGEELRIIEAEHMLINNNPDGAAALLADFAPKYAANRFLAALVQGKAFARLGQHEDASLIMENAEQKFAESLPVGSIGAMRLPELYEELENCYSKLRVFEKAYYYSLKNREKS